VFYPFLPPHSPRTFSYHFRAERPPKSSPHSQVSGRSSTYSLSPPSRLPSPLCSSPSLCPPHFLSCRKDFLIPLSRNRMGIVRSPCSPPLSSHVFSLPRHLYIFFRRFVESPPPGLVLRLLRSPPPSLFPLTPRLLYGAQFCVLASPRHASVTSPPLTPSSPSTVSFPLYR